jgi:hypothetical protein
MCTSRIDQTLGPREGWVHPCFLFGWGSQANGVWHRQSLLSVGHTHPLITSLPPCNFFLPSLCALAPEELAPHMCCWGLGQRASLHPPPWPTPPQPTPSCLPSPSHLNPCSPTCPSRMWPVRVMGTVGMPPSIRFLRPGTKQTPIWDHPIPSPTVPTTKHILSELFSLEQRRRTACHFIKKKNNT